MMMFLTFGGSIVLPPMTSTPADANSQNDKKERCKNKAGRLPENCPNSFVDLQTKKFVFSLKADMFYFN